MIFGSIFTRYLAMGRRPPVVIVSLVILAVAACAEDPAQQPLAFNDNGLMKMVTRVDEVSLLLTVTDSRRKFVPSLTEEDLQLLDNHQPPEHLTYFQTRTDLPLRVILLIDISSSIQARFPFEQQAATAFLKRVLRPAIDEAAIITFGDGVEEVQDMTSDVGKLKTAIGVVKLGGDTAMYDGLVTACNELSRRSELENVRRVIILITDGEDTRSRHSKTAALQSTLQAEAVIFAIDANVVFDKHSNGRLVLEELTRASGGFIVPARERSDFKTAFRSVEVMLRNQYALGYKPSDFNRDGSFRTIEVHARRHGLKVHYREGYWASAFK
jgi:Ca-activated chloride channel homolog